MKTPKEIVTEWVAGFNARDAVTIAALYHENATNLQVALGVPLQGKVAILADLISFFKAVPDNYTRIVNLFEEGEWAILEWSGGGTFINPDGSEGKPFALQGAGFFHVVEEKIHFQRGYWDKWTWFRQVGLEME